MTSAQKKVIVRQFEGGLAWGYLPQSHLLDSSRVPLMQVDGRLKSLDFSDIKAIAYVRDFNLNDPHDPERLGRRAFATRPRGDGLWLRLVFRDGDSLEGLSSVDLGLLDSLIDDRGLFLTPPDARSNTQRLFVPRPAIASLEVLGLVMAPARRAIAKKPAPSYSAEQTGLFNDLTSPTPRTGGFGASPFRSTPIPHTIGGMTLGELANRLGADLTPGDGGDLAATSARQIGGVAGIEVAGPTSVTFLANPKYAAQARITQAAALIVDPGFPALSAATLRIGNPYLAWAKAIEIFHPAPRFEPGIHPTAVVAASARLGQRAHIGPYVVVGEDCVLGDDAVLLAHVVLYPGVQAGHRLLAHAHAVVREGCRLGDDVVLQNGAVIGSDGFGFAKTTGGRWSKIVQSGPAVLEDSVEVQANACIDRASVGETRIAAGAKIDNLVQVGHGSRVGENTLLCAQVGLAGSTSVGNNVILAGQVGVAGHLTIGDGAVATAQTGIPSDVAPGAVVSGYPAMDNRAWLRTVAAINRLPELLRKLRSVEDGK